MRALRYLTSPSRIWAIEEGSWQEMVDIVTRERIDVETVEAALGKKLDNKATNNYEVIDGVAVIPIIGPIVKYGDMFSDISGATSVTRVTKDFASALKDDAVKSILLEIDSPGGEANGINELSEIIYESRGIKPIHSYISGMGCSAAYWIASSTDRIDMDETAVAGSIGVAGVITSKEEADAKAGIKHYKFVSDGSENKRPDLETDEGKAVVQTNLNKIAKVFRAKVARNRSNAETSLTVRDVIEKFNRGGTLIGEDAVKVGLVDGLSSYQSVLKNLINASGEESETSLNLKENIMAEKKVNASEESVIETKDENRVDANMITQLTETIQTLQKSNGDLQDKLTASLEDIKNLKASFESEQVTLRDENLTLKAVAESDKLKDRMTPAQKEKFVADYILRAKDDIANPVEGASRVDSLLEMWQASEKHNLTEEVLTPTDSITLSNEVEAEDDGIADLLARASAFAKQQNNKTHAQVSN